MVAGFFTQGTPRTDFLMFCIVLGVSGAFLWKVRLEAGQLGIHLLIRVKKRAALFVGSGFPD